MSRREARNEPAPQRRNPRRFVGESYRDCVDRLAGELTAAEMDRDALKARVAELEGDAASRAYQHTLAATKLRIRVDELATALHELSSELLAAGYVAASELAERKWRAVLAPKGNAVALEVGPEAPSRVVGE